MFGKRQVSKRVRSLTAVGGVVAATAVSAIALTATATTASASSFGCNRAVCLTLTNDGYARVSANSAFTGHFQLLMPQGHSVNSGNRSWAKGNNISWLRIGGAGKYCAIAWQSHFGGYTNIGEACEYVY